MSGGMETGATIGSAGGPIGAGIGAIIGGAADYMMAGSSARQQYEYQKKLYQHRYRWQVKDMIAAGLNPMLSAGASAPVPGGVQAPDYSGIGSKVVSAFNATRVANAQTQNLEQNTRLTSANADLAKEEATAKTYDNWEREADPKFQQVVATRVPGQPIGTTAYGEARFASDLKQIEAAGTRAAAEAETAKLRQAITQQELTQAEVRTKYADQLGELQRAYQEAMTTAARLKIPEARADAAFWENSGFVGKALVFIKGLIK